VVLHTGGCDHDGEEPPSRIDEHMPCAPLDLLVRIKAADPPFSVALTDWLEMTAVLDCRGSPAATRISPRSRSCITCQVPSWSQRQKS
jgi:hypothetical protein